MRSFATFLQQGSSLEGGIFGVLFTLSQEKNTTHIRYQWILLKVRRVLAKFLPLGFGLV